MMIIINRRENRENKVTFISAAERISQESAKMGKRDENVQMRQGNPMKRDQLRFVDCSERVRERYQTHETLRR